MWSTKAKVGDKFVLDGEFVLKVVRIFGEGKVQLGIERLDGKPVEVAKNEGTTLTVGVVPE